MNGLIVDMSLPPGVVSLSPTFYRMHKGDDYVFVEFPSPPGDKVVFIPEKLGVFAWEDVTFSMGGTKVSAQAGETIKYERYLQGWRIVIDIPSVEGEVDFRWKNEVEKIITGSFSSIGDNVVCPKGGCYYEGYEKVSIFEMVQHLNDHHGYTFDEVADWLETLDVDLTIKEAA